VPTDLARDAADFARSAVPVAAVAAGTGLACAAALKCAAERLFPRWTPARPGWHGAVALPLLVGHQLGVALVALMFAGLVGRPLKEVAIPAAAVAAYLAVVAAWAVRFRGFGVPWRWDTAAAGRGVLAGCAAFFAVTPVVMAVHYAALWVVERAGGVAVEHPLVVAGPGDWVWHRLVFFALVCVLTPLWEEVLFRGVLLKWACGTWRAGAAVLAVGALFAAGTGGANADVAVGFVGCGMLLFAGNYGLKSVRPRWPARTAGGVIATAVAFAAVHSFVWPSPVPLFTLGLALGYLGARTNGVVAPAVLHGLFNAVSAVYLLSAAR